MQILLEVLIAEVRRRRDLDIGVSASGGKHGVPSDSGVSNLINGGILRSHAPTDFSVSATSHGTFDAKVTLSALAARGDVRILSRPVLLAQNNQEAKILVGEQRPFVQVFRSLPTDNGVRDQVVQYRDVGTSLTVLPTINSDGYVNLQIQQEVSTATTETEFGAPVISTREASTHLFLRDGRTGVIGGLIDREREQTRSGIPLLSAIPGIGALFGTTHKSTVNSELFLFITPHVVRTDEDLERVRRAIQEREDSVSPADPDAQILIPPADGTPISVHPRP
jgi:general secretion pathway protein D